MKLALFDLDETLIAGDSDYLWGQFLCEQGHVDAEQYQAGHDKYYQDYLRGELNIAEFLEFQLAPLSGKSPAELHDWQQRYIETHIQPILLEPARKLIQQHRQQNHVLMVITATNRFLTEPIAKLLGVDNLIATEPEIKNGIYTGKPSGTPSYRDGKVNRLEEWLQSSDSVCSESWFYSDSHNDIPLLEYVDHPTAVDPDDQLREIAAQRGWPIITLRD